MSLDGRHTAHVAQIPLRENGTRSQIQLRSIRHNDGLIRPNVASRWIEAIQQRLGSPCESEV